MYLDDTHFFFFIHFLSHLYLANSCLVLNHFRNIENLSTELKELQMTSGSC